MDLEIAREEIIEVLEVREFTVDSSDKNVPLVGQHCFICTTKLISPTKFEQVGMFAKYVKTFCKFFELAEEPFERGFREVPMCSNCQHRIQLIGTIVDDIEKMRTKLQVLRECVINDLKLNYDCDKSGDIYMEHRLEVSLEELRRQLKSKLQITSAEKDINWNLEKTGQEMGDSGEIIATTTTTIPTFTLVNNLGESDEDSDDYQSQSPVYDSCNVDTIEIDDNGEFYCKQGKFLLENPQNESIIEVDENFPHPLSSIILTDAKVETPSKGIPSGSLNNVDNKASTAKYSEPVTLVNCSVRIERLSLKNITTSKLISKQMDEDKSNIVEDESEKCSLVETTQLNDRKNETMLNKLNCSRIQCTFVDPSGNRCRMRFPNDEKLDAHIKRLHMKIKSDHIYKCQICGIGKGSKKKLDDHVKIHTGVKDYTCDICGVSVRNEKFLVKHKRKVHGEPYPFVCDICNKGFNERMYLKAHQRSHTGEYTHRCEICNAGFAFLSALRKHMCTHSANIYECKVCNKKMRFKGSLQRHMRVHNGVKPHVCNICQKGFVDSAKLKNHVSIHTKERPFLCQKCGAAFRIKDHLNGHLKSHERTKVNIPKAKAKPAKKPSKKSYRNKTPRKTKCKLRTISATSETTATQEEFTHTQTNTDNESEKECSRDEV